MGNLAKWMLSNAVEALKDQNVELADEVIAKKRRLQ